MNKSLFYISYVDFINNVSKFYGEQTALQSVSLNIKKGEVVGFRPKWRWKIYLNENITYLSANEGEVKVCGVDVKKTLYLFVVKWVTFQSITHVFGDVYQRIFRICSRCLQIKRAYLKILILQELLLSNTKKLVNCRKDTDQGWIAQLLIPDPEFSKFR